MKDKVVKDYVRGLFFIISLSSFTTLTLADSEHTISWKERNNKIIHTSVCFNHSHNSIKYRACRVNAKKHFKEQCRYFEQKVAKTKYPYQKQFTPKKEKFCFSAGQFSPL